MPAKVTFAVVAGPLSGKSFVFEQHDTFLCGRNSDCHARILQDPRVSRHHFLLEVNPPSVRLRDLGSLNGTHVNGRKVGGREFYETPATVTERTFPEVELRDGDRIVIGKTTIEVAIPPFAHCSICHCALSGDEALAVAGQRLLCTACRNAPETVADVPASGAVICTHCGSDASFEAGARTGGQYVCARCRQAALEQSGGVHRLLEQAIRKSARHAPATLLDKYHIHEQVGKGGMGAVYRATRHADGSTVAIKMMLARVAVQEETRQAFLREIEIVGRLAHPNIVRLVESDSAGSTFYFIMEYCDGGSLHDLLKQQGGRLSLPRAVPLMLQVLEGLAYAHRAGFVHRDLKPQNVLVASDDRGSTIKIGDFGMAKQFALAGLSGMTATGTYGGTFHFMPREQLTNFKYALPASDVWSIAATFYHLLTGCYPLNFQQSRDPIEIILHDEPVPLLERDPTLPPALAAVIDRALSTDLAVRYADADAILAELPKTL